MSGASDDAIRANLAQSGWPEPEIREALQAATPEITKIPPPSNRLPAAPSHATAPHGGMWVGFHYIILYFSLYAASTSFAGILNHAVNQIFPDPLDKAWYSAFVGNFDEVMLRSYLASLIIMFPLFCWSFLRLKKWEMERLEVRTVKSRQIFIYLTLIIAAVLLSCHLTAILYGFLEGNATLRSLGHFMVTLLVAGSVLAYYAWDVRKDNIYRND